MIITRGLGGNLLITRGYGGEPVIRYFPYCPGVSVYGQSTQVISDVAVPYSVAVDEVAQAPSLITYTQLPYTPVLSPYTVVSGLYVEVATPYVVSAPAYTDNPSPYTALPNNCS